MTALVLNLFLTLCNIASIVTYCMESFPSNGEDGVSKGVWYAWEMCLMTIFTLELIFRAPAHTTLRQFVFRRPAVFVDFFACVPFDIYLFLGLRYSILDTRWLRPIRLLRVVSLGYLVFDLKLILSGIRKSMGMIALVWFLTILVLFSFASILFMAERGPWDNKLNCYVDDAGECAAFDSVPTSLYFCLEVVSSLGYGDIVPEKFISLVITMLLMIVSVAILATTVAVFSVQFEVVYQKTKRSIHIENLREASDLELRKAIFEGSNNQQILTREAACRLVTGIEALEAIASDLSITIKRIRADVILLSQIGTKGARRFNPVLAGKPQRLARVIEGSIANLGANACNDLDSLLWFALRSGEELFVRAVESFSGPKYVIVPHDSPRRPI